MNAGRSGKSKGKGKVPKKTPEEHGYQLVEGCIYVKARGAHLLRAVLVETGTHEHCPLQIGNLNKEVPGLLPQCTTELEVLCNRQTVFGNPFSMLRAKDGDKTGKAQPSEDEQIRQTVCKIFDTFLEDVLAPTRGGLLLQAAEETVQRLGYPCGIVGKDWARSFGSHTCEEFRAAYQILCRLVVKHHGNVRFLCHCVPLRCHTQALAERLWNDCKKSVHHALACVSDSPRNSTHVSEVPDGTISSISDPQTPGPDGHNAQAVKEASTEVVGTVEPQQRRWRKKNSV